MSKNPKSRARLSYDTVQVGTSTEHVPCYVMTSICGNIASELSRSYATLRVSGATVRHVINSVCTHTENPAAFQNLVGDYVKGAALSINPLPTRTTATYCTSDIDALHSDWVVVASDLRAVWDTASIVVEQLERLAREEAAGNTNDGRRTAGPPGTAGQLSRNREAKANVSE